MAKYIVYGDVIVSAKWEVDTNSEQDAMNKVDDMKIKPAQVDESTKIYWADYAEKEEDL